MYIDKPNSPITGIDVKKITAIWAFSESALGGILHVLKIPFTGLFIGSGAVFFICLLAQFGNSKIEILRATLLVILVKAVTTPFTPLNSYLAVTLQGMLGFIFFQFIPSKRIAALLLGITALFLASMQKVIMTTILFGTGIWDAIDTFVRFTFSSVISEKYLSSFSFSFVLIITYASIHLLAGIYVSIKVMNFRKWIERKRTELNINAAVGNGNNILFDRPRKKKRNWWRRKSGIMILSFLILLMIASYLFPQLGKSTATNIIFLLIRSIFITFIWFILVSPLIFRMFNKYIDSKKNIYTSEINSITILFPDFRNLISYAWENSSKLTGLKRLRSFISDSLALLLIHSD